MLPEWQSFIMPVATVRERKRTNNKKKKDSRYVNNNNINSRLNSSSPTPKTSTGHGNSDASYNKPAELSIEVVDAAVLASEVETLDIIINCLCCYLNGKYLFRLIWRWSTILHRLCLFLLIWRIIGGLWLIGIIIWETIFYATVYYCTKEIIFFEAFTGFVCQEITVPTNNGNINDNKSIIITSRYLRLSCIFYLIGLSTAFVIFFMTEDDLSVFMVEWFICCAFFTFISLIFILLRKNERVDGNLVVFRSLELLFCYSLFPYYVWIGLIVLDLLILLVINKYYNNKSRSRIDLIYSFWRLCLPFYKGSSKFKHVLFEFQVMYPIIYFVNLLFFGITHTTHSDSYVSFLNNSDIFIIYCLISLVGIFSIILPIWTYSLLFGSKIINSSVSNDRTLESLSKSGDVLAIIEFIEFGAQNTITLKTTKNCIEQAVNTHNFEKNIFPFMSFLQQYQLMRYLFYNYKIRVNRRAQNLLLEHVSKHSKLFKFRFKRQDWLLHDIIFR